MSLVSAGALHTRRAAAASCFAAQSRLFATPRVFEVRRHRLGAALCRCTSHAPACRSSPPRSAPNEEPRCACALSRCVLLARALTALCRSARASRSGEDLRRGYFDDLRDLKEDGGKKTAAPSALTPVHDAMPFPRLPLLDAAGAATALSAPGFVSLLFRAGAARAASTWHPAVAACVGAHAGALSFTQLSLVESWVFSLPGLKQLILRAGRAPPLPGGLGRHAFLFGDAEPLRRQLGLQNRLTAHVLLLDAAGRVRWKASGEATQEELQAAARLAAALLEEKDG